MHLLAVNYYVHYGVARPVNPNGKVKSIANTWPFNLYFRAFYGHESANQGARPAQILSIGRSAFRIFYMRVVN
ncbi:hypothetical protein C9I50_21005 [Pseudomonas prosekii]|uniref:Uncharacterized protein n=1 Tax=Pseudomonas prosekii TaxID=1148509 RepID=A0A1H2BAP6_9PSED|nr:hypothetical protein C9I50_21005 [Pseudomonas prosekii]PWE39168.1 hypothetical protein C9I49_26545 [Pseudomonas prosekii]SDT55293.1 hypothetical protein SAMN05216222_5049 [Pseudomonas prosekii]